MEQQLGTVTARSTDTADKAYVDVAVATATVPYDVSILATNTTRAVGSGENPLGVMLGHAATFSQATFRMSTAEGASGATFNVCRNGTAVTSFSPAASVTSGITTGSWAFNAGDVVTVTVSAISTTPGVGLTVDLVGSASVVAEG